MKRAALLSGPPLHAGAEGHARHAARLGPLPPSVTTLLSELELGGLRGRGGAAFPVATKWRAVASRAASRAVVLANGAEGEPLSGKDRLLMAVRPHLVLDGAVLAARAVGADRVVVYIGAEHTVAHAAVMHALTERAGTDRCDIDVVAAPARYVAGEESAAVHWVNDGVALPTGLPPRPYERGIAGRPTLVQNVETLAHVALIARLGGQWFADLGVDGATGTTLLTVSGDVDTPGVIEVAGGTALSTVLDDHAGATTRSAVLLGGYFGGWVDGQSASDLALDPARLRAAGHSIGCGVVHVRGPADCGVARTAQIVGFLAEQSARQCGPCVFGLAALALCLARIAALRGSGDDLMRVRAWSGELTGRGACRHPDGAANLVHTALQVFADEYRLHVDGRRCSAKSHPARVAA